MRKALSILLLVLIAIPLLTGASFLISLRSRALDREFWVSSLTDERLLEGVTGIITIEGALIEGAPEDKPVNGAVAGKIELGGWTFDAASLSRGVKAAFPRGEYRLVVESMVDAVLEGRGRLSNPEAATQAFIEALAGGGDAFAAAYLEGLPEGEGLPSKTDLSRTPKALGAEAYSRTVRPILSQAWEEAVRDTVAKGSPDASFARFPATRDLPAQPRSAVEGGIAGSLVLGLFALVGAAFLLGGPWSGRLVLMGTGLIISSVAALVFGIALRAGADARLIMDLVSKAGGPDIPEAAINVAGGLMAWAKDFLGALSKPFITTGIAGMGIGALLLSLRWPLAAREE